MRLARSHQLLRISKNRSAFTWKSRPKIQDLPVWMEVKSLLTMNALLCSLNVDSTNTRMNNVVAVVAVLLVKEGKLVLPMANRATNVVT